jgi:hypothetical protein
MVTALVQGACGAPRTATPLPRRRRSVADVTGDAAAYRTQLAHRIRPAPGVFDPDAAARSLDQLATLTERFPQLRVAVGHEPPL